MYFKTISPYVQCTHTHLSFSYVMTTFYFFSNPFYEVEVFYDGSDKETLMIIGVFFFLGARIHYAGWEGKKQPFYKRFNQWSTRSRGTVALFFFTYPGYIFFLLGPSFFSRSFMYVTPIYMILLHYKRDLSKALSYMSV